MALFLWFWICSHRGWKTQITVCLFSSEVVFYMTTAYTLISHSTWFYCCGWLVYTTVLTVTYIYHSYHVKTSLYINRQQICGKWNSRTAHMARHLTTISDMLDIHLIVWEQDCWSFRWLFRHWDHAHTGGLTKIALPKFSLFIKSVRCDWIGSNFGQNPYSVCLASAPVSFKYWTLKLWSTVLIVFKLGEFSLRARTRKCPGLSYRK